MTSDDQPGLPSPGRSLRHQEALQRADQLTVQHYDIRLDLTDGDADGTTTFRSVTTIDFTSGGGDTFVDLRPALLNQATLDDGSLDVDRLEPGRLPLCTEPGPHRLVVDATMRYRADGEGLHRSRDPADGRFYVYCMSFLDAAPSVFACFDQPDLKAPVTMHVSAPTGWTIVGNAPAEQVDHGHWRLAQSQPLATYVVTLVAGPWHMLHEEHDGIPLGLSARRSIAGHLDADAEELFALTKQCFDEYHRLFGIRYPFGDYHQAFVPEFNAGAMENPGCVTFRDPLVFTSRVTRGARIQRATTVAHEMAHQWFGNLTTPRWWDDLWLNESFAEYMGNRVTADVTEFSDAWTHDAYARRQWGLHADQRPTTHPVGGNGAIDARAALQDFDGISYTKGSSILKQINATLGDEVFFAGVIDHFERHRFGNAEMSDLLASWARCGGEGLDGFHHQWLSRAGADTLTLDREGGTLRRVPPVLHPAHRAHTLSVATAAPGDPWAVDQLRIDGAETPLEVGDRAVVLDPYEDTWALVHPDPETLRALPGLLADTRDARLRAGIWNNVRSGFHNALVDPACVLELLEAALPGEDNEAALSYLLPWAVDRVAPLSRDREGFLARLHDAAVDRAWGCSPGNTLQLAALQGAVASAGDVALLRSWLEGERLPTGVVVDLDLRWRVLIRLAVLGGVDRDRLDAALRAEHTARSQVDHTAAVAALPDAEAKAFAWARFSGEVRAPNDELEAAGTSMWRAGQEELTAPYAARYFDELPAAVNRFSGWVLADVAESYFPITSLEQETLDRALALAERPDLDVSLRRRVLDRGDELGRRLAVRRVFGS